MNKDIQTVWRYAAFPWHELTIKYRVSEFLLNLLLMDNDHTALHGIRALKLPLPWAENAVIYSWKQIQN
jgi:hypothetical protein